MIENTWRSILDIDSGNDVIVKKSELESVITIMMDYSVSPVAFSRNLELLIVTMFDEIDSSSSSLLADTSRTTASLRRVGTIMTPQMPLPFWFVAGFPDVSLWTIEAIKSGANDICESEVFIERVKQLIQSFENMRFDPLASWLGTDRKLRPWCCRNLIQGYRSSTKRDMETVADFGSDEDLYFGDALLDALGEDSSFTLIAANLTKYYLELSCRYRDCFSDEATLMAMAGVSAAKSYVLGTEEISVEQILSRSLASLSNQTPLVDFIVSLEVMMFSCDVKEIGEAEIADACEQQRSEIAKRVEHLRSSYETEKAIADDVDLLMTSPHFEQLRQRVGVQVVGVGEVVRTAPASDSSRNGRKKAKLRDNRSKTRWGARVFGWSISLVVWLLIIGATAQNASVRLGARYFSEGMVSLSSQTADPVRFPSVLIAQPAQVETGLFFIRLNQMGVTPGIAANIAQRFGVAMSFWWHMATIPLLIVFILITRSTSSRYSVNRASGRPEWIGGGLLVLGGVVVNSLLGVVASLILAIVGSVGIYSHSAPNSASESGGDRTDSIST